MRKIIIVLLAFILLAGLPIFSLADEEDDFVAEYVTPNPTIINDIPGNYNLIGTLRMTFPDICFEQNMEKIKDVLEGKRKDFFIEDTPQQLRYNYNVKLYLLGPQLMAYCGEFYKLGITNPLWDMAINSYVASPTAGKVNLLQMLRRQYSALGFFKAMNY